MGRENDFEFVKWAKEIKIRDRFICQICDMLSLENKNTYLESHHLFSWDKYPNLRYDEQNGICICKYHHDSFHERFGFGNNTKYQFDQYVQIIKIFEKLLKSETPPAFLSFNEKKEK